jgi:ATP-dependent helicase HepA
MGRFDRFGSGNAIESVAIVCSDDPDEMAWVDCLDKGFYVFSQSLASLQYLVDEAMSVMPEKWMGKGTSALLELTESLTGKAGWIARERRRIDQQDTLDSLGTLADQSFEEIEALDNEWKSWGNSFRALAEKTLQLARVPISWQSPLPAGDEVFRIRYSANGNIPTLFPLSVFISDFIGTLDTDAPGANSRNLLTFPYSLRRNTSLTRDGVEHRVRPLRFGDPLVEALLSFCNTDDRGRIFAMWRHWPGYKVSDSSGHDLFFRFDFLIEADLGTDNNDVGTAKGVASRALRRRVDGCFPPEFITVWVGVDRQIVDTPTKYLQSKYREKEDGTGTGRDFNLNPNRWQKLSIRDDVPWLRNWSQVCQQAYSDALSYVKKMSTVTDRIENARRLLDEQSLARTTRLKNRIERLSGSARTAEETELTHEIERNENLKRSIEAPNFHLDVVGAIFVSPENFDDD